MTALALASSAMPIGLSIYACFYGQKLNLPEELRRLFAEFMLRLAVG